jgi:hypothetical protein
MFKPVDQALPQGKTQRVLVNPDLVEAVLPFGTNKGAKLTLWFGSGREIEITQNEDQWRALTDN